MQSLLPDVWHAISGQEWFQLARPLGSKVIYCLCGNMTKTSVSTLIKYGHQDWLGHRGSTRMRSWVSSSCKIFCRIQLIRQTGRWAHGVACQFHEWQRLSMPTTLKSCFQLKNIGTWASCRLANKSMSMVQCHIPCTSSLATKSGCSFHSSSAQACRDNPSASTLYIDIA